jgi:hypothetical protein
LAGAFLDLASLSSIIHTTRSLPCRDVNFSRVVELRRFLCFRQPRPSPDSATTKDHSSRTAAFGNRYSVHFMAHRQCQELPSTPLVSSPLSQAPNISLFSIRNLEARPSPTSETQNCQFPTSPSDASENRVQWLQPLVCWLWISVPRHYDAESWLVWSEGVARA